MATSNAHKRKSDNVDVQPLDKKKKEETPIDTKLPCTASGSAACEPLKLSIVQPTASASTTGVPSNSVNKTSTCVPIQKQNKKTCRARSKSPNHKLNKRSASRSRSPRHHPVSSTSSVSVSGSRSGNTGKGFRNIKNTFVSTVKKPPMLTVKKPPMLTVKKPPMLTVKKPSLPSVSSALPSIVVPTDPTVTATATTAASTAAADHKPSTIVLHNSSCFLTRMPYLWIRYEAEYIADMTFLNPDGSPRVVSSWGDYFCDLYRFFGVTGQINALRETPCESVRIVRRVYQDLDQLDFPTDVRLVQALTEYSNHGENSEITAFSLYDVYKTYGEAFRAQGTDLDPHQKETGATFGHHDSCCFEVEPLSPVGNIQTSDNDPTPPFFAPRTNSNTEDLKFDTRVSYYQVRFGR